MQTSNPTADKAISGHKPLHIITTSFLEGDEVLVRFSDGTSAIYALEELEKLRPARKQTLPPRPAAGGQPIYTKLAMQE